MSFYRQFGIESIINAAGTLTRLGGAILPDPVINAMHQAAQDAVSIEDLQSAACRIIARVTGAKSGIVTSGASAGLTLGAAAILAGNDLARIERLPDTSSIPNEFLIARDQRNGYDHAVRAAGAKLTEVGLNEIVAGSGVRPVEIWEYEAAITDRTAGVLYVLRDGSRPALQEVVDWAHAKRFPVLVDAAAELYPRSNLRDIPATGADLVVFSGGKAIRGPQSSGILCGTRDLIESAAMQMLDMDERRSLWNPVHAFIDPNRWLALPRQGIGRGFKVSKEQIAGLLVALELFVNGSQEEDFAVLDRRLERIKSSLGRGIVVKGATTHPPYLTLETPNVDPAEMTRKLRSGEPAVYVRMEQNSIAIDLTAVRKEQDSRLIERLAELFQATGI